MLNFLALVVVSVLLSACFSIKNIPFSTNEPFNEQAISDSLNIQFNGIAHFYMLYKGSAVVTDPFLSNPSLHHVIFGKVYSDTQLIQSFNQKPKSHHIKMIVIGHAHYDHILDLPYYLPYLPENVLVLGGYNTVQLCKTLSLNKLVNVEPYAATDSMMGTWIYSTDSAVRIMPVCSYHLPHLGALHLWKGKYQKSLAAFPVKAKAFKKDATFAYLIDFLFEKKIPVKRIYFSSSAAPFPNGFFPKNTLDEKSVDVAILSLALSDRASCYPDMQIAYLMPKHTILCHWENFFRNR
ncbi:MAG: hypothetical protein NZ522_06650, partial [Chitinophagales bacterium]|nr:hypothetical protein [Chitinophagales bacterium]